MIQGLNEQQSKAVTQGDKHVLVLAGAGSGKTRVLTTRMAWLIQNGLSGSGSLMAVTFTNKAAREMVSRLTAQIPINTRSLWIGTFHGLCHRLLRTHYKDASLDQTFQILDSADQLSVIKRVLKTARVDDSVISPRDLQYFINSAKESGLRPDAVEAFDARDAQMLELYRAYQRQCETESVVDFAELLLRSLELLERNEPIRVHYQQRFKHILVDEFQDTNKLQYRWLQMLANGGASIFAVGDDDQSIYAFRGADIHNMSHFERYYAAGNVIRLEQNYRSCGHILDAANALIEHNTGRLGKNLWTDQGHGEPIGIVEQDTDTLEAQWVTEKVQELIYNGVARDEIAILYRSNAQSRAIEHTLFSSGIPYKVYGGLRFFERQEVKHALAYMRLIHNPHDDTAWLRVSNFPTRGIGLKTTEILGELAKEHNTSLYGAVAFMSGRSASNLISFINLIQTLNGEAQHLSLPDLVKSVIQISGLEEHYKKIKDGSDRLDNLNELVSAAAAFVLQEGWEDLPAGRLIDDNESALSPLASFLSHASLEAGDNQAQTGENAVQLMTVHSAKGLEFDNVFITGLEDGLFPHEQSLNDVDGLEEERRLMYVAITRARKKLYITLARSRMLHGKTRYVTRSQFLAEIPDQHVVWLTPKDNHFYTDNSQAWKGAFRRGGSAFNSNVSSVPLRGRSATSSVSVSGNNYRVGQGVKHARFGEGTVLSISGNGEDAQAKIHFKEVGTKTLALGIAKLDVIAG